jgi:hypothetical protein
MDVVAVPGIGPVDHLGGFAMQRCCDKQEVLARSIALRSNVASAAYLIRR